MVAVLFSHPEPKGRIRPMDLLLATGYIATGTLPLLVAMLDTELNPELYDYPIPNMPYLIILVIFQGVFQLVWRFSLSWCFVLVMGVQILIAIELAQSAALFSPIVYILYLLAKHYTTRRALTFTAAAITLEFTARALTVALQDGSMITMAVNFAMASLLSYISPLLFSMWLRSKNQYQQLLRDNAAKEYEANLEKALVAERQRLAGELHDVAAHHLAGIAVQAAAINSLIDRDPAVAKEAAQQLRRQAKEALGGMRQVVGLLREGETAPKLRDIHDLITTTESLGVNIELHMPTTLPKLSQPIDAAAYRTVQQAISNALQHAPGAWLNVEITQQEQQLDIVITNGLAQRGATFPGGGAGLALMQERITTVGGKFSAGPTTAGGWQVHVSLPIDTVNAPATTDALQGVSR